MFERSLWIWQGKGEPDEYADFCLDFCAEKGKNYLLYICCDSDYALYNGKRIVAFGQYSDYPENRVFDTVDLSHEIISGENNLKLTVWYQGKNSSTYVAKAAGVIFTLTEDGKTILCSSPEIKSRISPYFVPHKCLFTTVQMGLTFSYNAEAPETEYNKSTVVNGLPKPVTPRPIKKLTLSEPLKSTLVEMGGYRLMGGETAGERMQNAVFCDDGQGVYAIYDLGAESVGFIKLRLETDTPCDVMVGWGEHLIDKRCRTRISSRNFSFEYRAKKGENDFFCPFRRMGCRYLQIFVENPNAKIINLTLLRTDYPVNAVPFSTNNDLRDKIYNTCINTLVCCMHEHYEDCPWREQALYALDSRNQMLSGYYAFNETEFAKASLDLISSGVRDDGLLTLCYPTEKSTIGRPIPSFTLVFPIQMWEYLEHSGDIEFISQKYVMLEKLFSDFAKNKAKNGLVSICRSGIWNFYEWEKGLSGNNPAPFEAPLNAFYALSLKAMSRIAEALGKENEAKAYLYEASAVNDAIALNFFNEADKLFATRKTDELEEYSVLVNSLCLLCGAAEGKDKTNILEMLASNGKSGFPATPNTLSMNAFRFDALLNEDKEKYKTAILDEIDRVYGKMLESDATSFWETEKGAADFSGAGSLCHGWSALPVYYYHKLLK